MSSAIFIVPLLLVLPAILTFLVKKAKIDDWLSPVVACYGIGILLGNLGLINISGKMFNIITQATIPLAIPLLLITTDFKHWLINARPTLKAIALSISGVLFASFTVFFLFRHISGETITVVSMITGGLIGTSANVSAVGMALNANTDTFMMVSGCDVIIGGLFLIYITAFAKKIYQHVLPAYSFNDDEVASGNKVNHIEEEPLSLKEKLKDAGLSFAVAAMIAGLAVALVYLTTGVLREDLIIICISLGGIITAMSSTKIRSLKMAEPSGQYLLLIFCIVIGLRADFSAMMHQSVAILAMVACLYGLSGFYQFILSWLFKVDVDTSIITTAGTIYGPVFIGQIAASIKNKDVILTGMVTAILGYALGNFAGIMMSWVLGWL